ncbi:MULTISPECIES: pyocin activator PrtN family protein [unclassified Pseudomonas]|uniref:pyocin activator PrtN family protein n=1 Tax=unclassified Pseudomonas TaxID=196821 RepID=UPI002448098D|nr:MULTISPECIES: pyocin activator PrtN family protein [unclassified Pseudomonas]MDG9926145.1 pyocin activator PrtN family protein [Pseudomonas sp. GD04045]MDH0037489.1 pyocin activator PrtN family protein [Pseudomonas sp. GD04019]
MSNTQELLQARWKATSLSLTEVRQAYFPHLKTDKSLRALINKGEIKLATFKAYPSRVAPLRVRMADLATYLDTQAQTAA